MRGKRATADIRQLESPSEDKHCPYLGRVGRYLESRLEKHIFRSALSIDENPTPKTYNRRSTLARQFRI